MPAASDILQYLRGQLFETPTLPKQDFKGKTVVLTGANSGLGFESAKQLVHLHVSTLILACRDTRKGEAAKSTILAATSSGNATTTEIQVWHLDMSSYASVQRFASRLKSEIPRLDAVIANAGIDTIDFQLAEGLEETLTVNVTSTILLGLLTLPQLRQTAEQSGESTHLTFTGSAVHCFADPSELQKSAENKGRVLEALSREGEANMVGRYFLSKLILILCFRELAQRLPLPDGESAGVIINYVNPGWCKTALFRHNDGGFLRRTALKLMGRTGEVGARTLTSAVAAGRESHGEYLSEGRPKRASVFVRSEEGRMAQKEMWKEVLELTEGVEAHVLKMLN